jgi:hypothetical protein
VVACPPMSKHRFAWSGAVVLTLSACETSCSGTIARWRRP